MKTAVAETSISAFYSLLNSRCKTQADRIFDIVNAYCQSSGRDLSLNEIKRIHVGLHGDIELSTVSARVNALVAANRLQRLASIRPCTVTGKAVHPVRLPVGQGVLF